MIPRLRSGVPRHSSLVTRHSLRIGLFLSLAFPLRMAPAQELGSGGAAALGSAISGIGVSGRVLIIGAHPDDEDTQIIAWLSKGRHVETAYLSLTRGDGGQNVIGNELGEALGIVRTEELLAARRVDGARQYFTRAYDYGYSRGADEAFTHWPHDSLLRDVITVVRAFRPHVIISVFTGTARDGHGQHQASGIVAREAYDLAGDTTRFPRAATAGLGPWTVSKFYRGATFRAADASLRINVGEYDPLLGRSYAEIAAVSRSQHKSQAFGTLERKGVRWDYLQREASRVPAPDDAPREQSIFDGIDTTWARFRNQVAPAARARLDSLPAAFAEARRRFDAMNPGAVVPALVRLGQLLQLCGVAGSGPADACRAAADPPGATGPVPPQAEIATAVTIAEARLARALALATGLALEATVEREVWATGDSVPWTLTVYNRGPRPVRLVHADASVGGDMTAAQLVPVVLAPDSTWTWRSRGFFRAPTQPYWLASERRGAMYSHRVTGIDDRTAATDAWAGVSVEVDGVTFRVRERIVHRFADQVEGEMNRPIAGAPAVSLLLDRELEYAQAGAPLQRPIRVHLRSAGTDSGEVTVTLRLPPGLVADSTTRRTILPAAGAVRTVTFQVRGQLPPGRHEIEAVAATGGQSFASGYTLIDYDHINPRRQYRPARLALESVELARPEAMRVAYIQGVGDNSAPMLAQLGIDVTLIDPAALPMLDLSRYTAVVVGPRAYESSPALVANNARLLEYVQGGGTMVVQYGQYEMMRPGMMPYPVTINRPHDRVTIEDAPVRILDPSAPVLNTPNRITARDFEGWVQDRSLYMPRTFDERYRPVLEMNDPGQPPVRGALLVAPYGRGTYVYTTLAFFRQLPGGVPGAARLFVNLLAASARPAGG
ncbi:MAG TPA: PIG-L family deacetylase [Gemmatimonadaceae bacterium]|nr:PIG-L family deacetylase [Gemmatimonadaceae bacterium]